MKGRSIIEVTIVFSLLQLVLLIPEGMRNLVRWENRALGGSYVTGILMIALVFFIVIIRQIAFSEIGLIGENWRESVNFGIRGWVFFFIPQLLITFFSAQGLYYKDRLDLSIVLGSIIIFSAIIMSKREIVKKVTNRRLFFIGALIISLFILKIIYDRISITLMKDFLWNILIGGFIEEFYYRGFIQSHINSEFGKDWKLGNIHFGPGLLISSFFYGLSRGLRTIKPWKRTYILSWNLTIVAFAVGLFYGLIRESSGDIIGSGTANSLIDAIGKVLSS
jgi:membrane protease YdiL (CAAX protease family)